MNRNKKTAGKKGRVNFMTIRQLEIFKTVCAHMSVTRAAEALYMTQPAVSRAISELEEETGIILFERLARKIYLTEPGKAFLLKAVRFLEMHDELLGDAERLSGSAKIRIGSCITIANYILPEILKEYLKARAERTESREAPEIGTPADMQECYRKIPFEIQVDSAANIEKKLLANEIDLAFLEGAIKSPAIEGTAISSYRIGAAAAPDHPFAGRENIPLDELLAQPLLLREKGSAVRDAFDSYLLIRQKTAVPVMTSVNSQALIRAAAAGLGIAILPEILIKEQQAAGYATLLNLQGMELMNNNYIAHHKEKYLNEEMHLLIELALRTGRK